MTHDGDVQELDSAMTARLTLRLDFDDGRRLGHGKIALLEAIRRTGSISAAGREFGMAYRRAWLLTDELNHMFSAPLIEARGGGKNGGGAVLTPLGEQVVTLYRAAEQKAVAVAAEEIARIDRAVATSVPVDT
jgi:molybdate transport system regulatory protein